MDGLTPPLAAQKAVKEFNASPASFPRRQSEPHAILESLPTSSRTSRRNSNAAGD